MCLVLSRAVLVPRLISALESREKIDVLGDFEFYINLAIYFETSIIAVRIAQRQQLVAEYSRAPKEAG